MISKESSHEHKWHRQSGLLDQEMVASLEISLEGHDEGVLAMLLQLDLLGACRNSSGVIRIDRDSSDEVSIRMLRGLVDFTSNTWGGIQKMFGERGMEISLCEIGAPDIWIGTAKEGWHGDGPGAQVWLIHGAGSALLGSGQFPRLDYTCVRDTMIDSATLICGVSALLHRYLAERSAFWGMEIVDRWLTLTARVDGVDPELALKRLKSDFGPGTATRTSDGEGSLVRFRIPLERTPPKLISFLWQPERLTWDVEAGPEDVGPFPSKASEGGYCFDSMALPEELSDVNALVLGVGGLGSWAAPLLLTGCAPTTTKIELVDGDQEVEVHNLNRQVLYDSSDLGCAKATAAASRLSGRFEMEEVSVVGIPAPLGAQHVIDGSVEVVEGDVGLQEIIGESEYDEHIKESLDSMHIALSCLDNQNARTLLNRACLDRGVSMVNGGGEGTRGVVEHFGEGLCMVCRYGPHEAYATERVSCQEEGARPVSSIVTTTAYVGAMQAAIALCLLAAQRGHGNEVPEARDWSNGRVSRRDCGRLPWIEGDCGGHL